MSENSVTIGSVKTVLLIGTPVEVTHWRSLYRAIGPVCDINGDSVVPFITPDHLMAQSYEYVPGCWYYVYLVVDISNEGLQFFCASFC